MENQLLMIILIILIAVMLALAGIIICLIRAEGKISQDPDRQNIISYSSPTAYARCWHMEIWNPETNQIFSKDFYGQVMLGRTTSSDELFWQMRIGEDVTISRQQCVIYDRGGFLVIENVSQVNVTLLNGYPVNMPMMLSQGCQLTAGRNAFYISALQRIA